MGMYTELVIKADVKRDLPADVEAVLQALFNDAAVPETLPEHDFFKANWWQMVGSGNSHYHVPFTFSKYDQGYLFSRSDLKNYGSEIELFVDWVKPYLDVLPGACFGWQWYEEDDVPTLLIM